MSRQQSRPEPNRQSSTSNEPASAPNPSLIAEGWERRFVAAGPRLREAVELYQELGYEVVVEYVRDDELPDDCQGCQAAAALFMTIYTRMG